ncbi:protein kinase [Nannocystis pusilla]|uniref:Protein kinase n=1 Tax=Nannocystis pusilla TaxID=889268 RepID=A0A9X3F0U7_9BACT|nr:protein kinase [Nannocystis pusilla]MCY1013942.1 protein kinase [Nannocystis pusilla]
MTGEDESLGATLAATGQGTNTDSGEVELRPPPPGAGTPVDKEIVKRALFPGRGGPLRIGRFTVLGQVGRGAMGVVYACYDDLLDRKVAVKLLKHTAAGDPSAAQVRLREAQALARLDHPDVVKIHDVGTFEDRVYLAMEFVDGQTLGAWLTAAPRTWQEILAVVIAAGEGLAAAHAKGLVHRDIKPDNIMVGGDGRVRLMDFGLARAEASAAPAGELAGASGTTVLTHTGAIMGTPAFMAPEQFLGEPVDARSDQFALCATAWEALYGQRPFAGDTLPTLMASVTAGVVTPPPRARAPQWLRRVLERASRATARPASPTRGRCRRPCAPTRPAGAGPSRSSPARSRCSRPASARPRSPSGARSPPATPPPRPCSPTGTSRPAPRSSRPFSPPERPTPPPPRPRRAVARPLGRLVARGRRRRLPREPPRSHLGRRAVRPRGRLPRRGPRQLRRARRRAAARRRGQPHRGHQRRRRARHPEPCADPTYLRERPLLRFDQRAQISAVRARLARAGSLAAAGRYAEGLPVAREALHAAVVVGWLALVAQAELRAAGLAEHTGAYAEAEAGLLRALAAAREARSARLALQASTELVFVVGYRGSRLAEGKVWAESARTQLALLAGAHPLEQADLDSNLAGVQYVGGELGAAVDLYARVLAAREAALGEQHPRVADSVNNLAGVRYATGAIDEAARSTPAPWRSTSRYWARTTRRSPPPSTTSRWSTSPSAPTTRRSPPSPAPWRSARPPSAASTSRSPPRCATSPSCTRPPASTTRPRGCSCGPWRSRSGRSAPTTRWSPTRCTTSPPSATTPATTPRRRAC